MGRGWWWKFQHSTWYFIIYVLTLYTKYNILYKLYDLRTYTLMIWHDKQSRPHYQSNKQSWRDIIIYPHASPGCNNSSVGSSFCRQIPVDSRGPWFDFPPKHQCALGNQSATLKKCCRENDDIQTPMIATMLAWYLIHTIQSSNMMRSWQLLVEWDAESIWQFHTTHTTVFVFAAFNLAHNPILQLR